MSRIGIGTYRVGNVPQGTYVIKMTRGKQVRSMKITL